MPIRVSSSISLASNIGCVCVFVRFVCMIMCCSLQRVHLDSSLTKMNHPARPLGDQQALWDTWPRLQQCLWGTEQATHANTSACLLLPPGSWHTALFSFRLPAALHKPLPPFFLLISLTPTVPSENLRQLDLFSSILFLFPLVFSLPFFHPWNPSFLSILFCFSHFLCLSNLSDTSETDTQNKSLFTFRREFTEP